MKKIMILGAGYTQVPLHEAAKKAGFRTIAASIPGNYDSFKLADEICYVDISDPDAVLEAARQTGACGICTCGLDLGVKAIGTTCEGLGLPGMSKKAADTVSNKYDMKLALTAAGVRTAPFFCIHNEDELETAINQLSFPVIMKATDLMGSRGIFKCETPEAARINFKKSIEASKKDFCLIEQFIEGTLFGVEAMIQNGKILFMLPNNTEVFVGTTNIPVGHSIPHDEIVTKGEMIISEVTKAIRACRLDNCPVNCDCIMSEDGDTYIVEITGRSGATGLSELVSLKYGIDYYEVIARLAMGEDVSEYFSSPKNIAVLTHTMTAPREGTLRRIVDHNPVRENVIEMSFNIAPGDHIQPFTNGRDRIGQIVITGKDLEQCRRTLKAQESLLRYELEGDLPLIETPIERIDDINSNEIFAKREDLIPFSYGGNKVRFSDAYLRDMTVKGCDAIIIYGGYSSNLCRILSEACAKRNIPCSMIYNIEDSDPDKKSTNSDIIRKNNVKEYRCTKSNIAETVEAAINDFIAEGRKPYYMHGDKFGQGNSHTPMATYVDVYFEILKQEREMGEKFDLIFIGSSTNTSQSGLIAGKLINGDDKTIVGISVNRGKKRAVEVIENNLKDYAERTGCFYIKDNISGELADADHISSSIIVADDYLCGGYGKSNDELILLTREMYETSGLEMDTTYCGKAFYGMRKYLQENNISGKKVLFIHSGGTVFFRDSL